MKLEMVVETIFNSIDNKNFDKGGQDKVLLNLSENFMDTNNIEVDTLKSVVNPEISEISTTSSDATKKGKGNAAKTAEEEFIIVSWITKFFAMLLAEKIDSADP